MPTFVKIGLEKDTCKCLEKAIVDTESYYTHRINKPKPKENDFRTSWEKGKRSEDCKDICNKITSLSVNKWVAESQNLIIQKYLMMKELCPRDKDSILIFKLKSDVGLFVHTPKSKDIYHYDLYKSDEFDVNNIEEKEILLLSDYI